MKSASAAQYGVPVVDIILFKTFIFIYFMFCFD
jgi:hypothetical protein